MKPNANPFRGVVLLICVLALIFCATSIFRTTTHQTTYSYADIRDLFQQEKVETVQVDEDTLTLTLKEPVFCRFSLFRNKSHPLMAENVFELVTFTLWILPCRRFAAASTSLLFI